VAEPVVFAFALSWHVVEVLGQGPILAMQGQKVPVSWGSGTAEAVVREVSIDFAHRKCEAKLAIYEPTGEIPWASDAAGMFSLPEEPDAQA
jgi:hypothetical protein